ncbi:hypothetical protein [Lactiplantibacillus plantarum]|uniref:hypothetical protein n=1 Tax=Lactiplantibacillus plantarum TaxID=1590 RepID=UPI000975B91A|nr:hypothetical protein [Lactiplantibacillus plantarum]
MTAIINTIFLISFIAFLYFIGRGTLKFLTKKDTKHSFKYGLLSLLVSLVFMVIGIIFDPAIKSSSESNNYNSVNSNSTTSKESADSTSQSHSSKSSSSKKYDFSKVRLGMTKSQVIAIMGKPTEQDTTYLMYGSDDLDFHDDKLFDGSPRNIKEAATKKEKNEAKESIRKRVNESELKSFAKVFGQKDVETLQKYVGSAYSSIETSQGMAYGWKTDYGMLYRLDDSSTGITHVYKDGLGDSGTQLYVGQTIKQKQRRNYYYYN